MSFTTNLERFKPILIRWEFLRFFYNMVLILVVTIVIGSRPDSPWGRLEFWAVLIGAAIFANACFCAGPVVDAYLDWLGIGNWWTTAVIFAVGTAFAGILAYLIIRDGMGLA